MLVLITDLHKLFNPLHSPISFSHFDEMRTFYLGPIDHGNQYKPAVQTHLHVVLPIL